MANIKQQKKRIKTNQKAKLRNSAFKTSMRTAIKQVETAVDNNKHEVAVTANNFAYKKLDKALAKGLVHKNYVARKKSYLTKLVNTIK